MTRKAELTTVIEEGKRVRTRFLDVRALPSPLSHPRVGVVVPKRHRTTVDRNRVKRRLRELIRLHVLPDAGSLNLVIRARDEVYNASFKQLRADLLSVMVRIRQLVEKSA